MCCPRKNFAEKFFTRIHLCGPDSISRGGPSAHLGPPPRPPGTAHQTNRFLARPPRPAAPPVRPRPARPGPPSPCPARPAPPVLVFPFPLWGIWWFLKRGFIGNGLVR